MALLPRGPRDGIGLEAMILRGGRISREHRGGG
jgi:hypothetical protein